MRRLAILVIAACGSKPAVVDDGPAVPDGSPDAFVLPPCATPVAGTAISTRELVQLPDGESPLLVTAPVNDPRLFVVTREGTIRIVEDEALRATPFLDLSDRVFVSGEAGLLGLAFHPQYATNRQLFVAYVRSEPGDTTYRLRDVVARCKTSEDPDVADPASCEELLAIPDSAANHNGGMLAFGRDGFLHIGTGDGGNAGDPQGNAQALADGETTPLTIALLGKLLRIDVDRADGARPYAIPADNPFPTSGAPEVYARGLRNPWRWSFDRATGDLWIGDVGQDEVEEIDFVKAGELAGANFGWKNWEGSRCFAAPCPPDERVFPVVERLHASPDRYTAIIGGQVYRGTCFPDLVGTYVYADHAGSQLATAVPSPTGFTFADLAPLPGETFPNGISSIHEDARGELYITTIAGTNRPGAIHRLEVHP